MRLSTRIRAALTIVSMILISRGNANAVAQDESLDLLRSSRRIVSGLSEDGRAGGEFPRHDLTATFQQSGKAQPEAKPPANSGNPATRQAKDNNNNKQSAEAGKLASDKDYQHYDCYAKKT